MTQVIAGAALHHRANRFLQVAGVVVAVVIHGLARRADRNAFRRSLNVLARFQIFRASFIEINERLDALVLQQVVDR